MPLFPAQYTFSQQLSFVNLAYLLIFSPLSKDHIAHWETWEQPQERMLPRGEKTRLTPEAN